MSNCPNPLEILSIEDLERVIVDRLHELRSIGPPADMRMGESHIEWLIDQFREGSAGLRDRMIAIFRRLLKYQCQSWEPAFRGNLLDVLQECGDSMSDEIFVAVNTGLLLEQCGAEAHAGLLKCLISVDRKCSPEFWIAQSRRLGPEYGALILSGLVQHGLRTGMEWVSQLSANDTAAREIRLMLPLLDDLFGREDVEFELHRVLPRCTAFAQEVLRLGRPGTPVSETAWNLENGNTTIGELLSNPDPVQPILTGLPVAEDDVYTNLVLPI